MKKVLVVDDEPSILTLLTFNLEKEGYQVTTSEDGKNGFELALSNQYDFIILDVMLPGMDGLEITKALRREKIDTPILILTAKDEQVDKIIGLEIGADDYLTKPFEVEELFARMRVALRNKKDFANNNFVVYGSLKLDINGKKLYKNDKEISLTKTEYNLFCLLLLNKEIVVSREKILEEVWGFDYDGEEKIVDVYINALRKKVDDEKEKYIHTVRGFGYVLKK